MNHKFSMKEAIDIERFVEKAVREIEGESNFWTFGRDTKTEEGAYAMRKAKERWDEK